ncbi:MAG: hypothetical protein SFU55_11420 [Methylophilus sp.]|nr:hypothetical protein [Methylophilus sp.]
MQDLSRIGQVTEIQIDNNRTLRYLKAGKGNPLILLHTIRTQLDYFQEVIPTLAQYYTVYALDLPSHGYSTIDTKASYDEPYFRQAVVAFIEKLDLREVTIVGDQSEQYWRLPLQAQCQNELVKLWHPIPMTTTLAMQMVCVEVTSLQISF